MTNEEFTIKMQEFRDKINGARQDADKLRALLEEEEKFIKDYDISRLEDYVAQIDKAMNEPTVSEETFQGLWAQRAGTLATLAVLKNA